MNGDIRPPRSSRSNTPGSLHISPRKQAAEAHVSNQSSDLSRTSPPLPPIEERNTQKADGLPSLQQEQRTFQPPTKKSKYQFLFRSLAAIGGFLLILLIAAVGYYVSLLRPVSGSEEVKNEKVTIVAGSSPQVIGQSLEEKNLIRSQLAFDIYTRISGVRGQLQAGVYSLSPAESTQEIVKHITSGKTEQISLTFFPGATLRDTTDKDDSKKTDVETVLLRAGYSQEEISAAFLKEYDHPLFASKPQNASIEGYVYGDTYNFEQDVSVEQILQRTFDEFYEQIQEYDLINQYKKKGLSLYEGITLASIVQREVAMQGDQRQVSQVFLLRLENDMPLGSDVTYQYAADVLGVERDFRLDSPYNTRQVKGLPPGPIAAPGLSALRAVANPADGDFLYFVSGDDGKNYFSHTLEEHESNVEKYCHEKCALP